MRRFVRPIALSIVAALAACGDDSSPRDVSDANGSGDAQLDAVADAAPDAPTDDGGADADVTRADAGGEDAGPRDCSVDNGGCGVRGIVDCVDDACVWQTEQIRDILLDGIDALDTTSALPSALVVHGENATPVVVDSAGRPIIAAAVIGDGRAVVVSHEGVLGYDPASDSGFARLVLNAAAWVDNSLGAGRVGIWPGMEAVGATLETVGWQTQSATTDNLEEIDVLVMTSYDDLSPLELESLHRWLERGGGLIVGGHAWWWGYENDDAPRNYPGNRTIAPTGITITEQTADQGLYPLPDRRARDLHHAVVALDALAEHVAGGAQLSDADLAAAASAAGTAIDTLPLDWAFFDEAEPLDEAVGPVVPSREDPVVLATEPIVALAARLQVRRALDAPVDEVEAHPSSSAFPGAVADSADRVTVRLMVDGDQPTGPPSVFAYGAPGAAVWRSTGLYAAPGDTVTVSFPAEVVDSGVALQIGAHTDELYGLDEWHRMPRVVRSVAVDAAEVAIANGFGGPLYVAIPLGSELGEFAISVSGAVVMPRYDAQGDGLDGWEVTRDAAAPWAELAGENFVVTVPAEAAAGIDAPDVLMALWDDVLDADADLAGISFDRARAERFVVDQQISAGWMHSGYPIMAHLESATEVLDHAALLSNGAWGPLHELGHNHQNYDWVLPGTTESSVNLWSVYASEEVFGVARADAHPAMTTTERQARVDAWKAGTDRDWSVWMALETYLQLQEEFGWAVLQTTFANYLALAEADRPADDAERAQLWIVMSSQAANRDLTDFYEAWDFAVTADTRATVAELAAWTEHPMR